MALAQDPGAGRPKATMWHGPASHTPAASIAVQARWKRQEPAKPKASMWHGPASHAPPDNQPSASPLAKRQNPLGSRPKATMWHGPASLGSPSSPTSLPILRKRQDPVGSRPKASMWHGPASNAPFDDPSPVTDLEKRASTTQLDMTPFAGMKPLPGLASPAAPLPVFPFDPKPNNARPNGTMSTISASGAFAASAASPTHATMWHGPQTLPTNNVDAPIRTAAVKPDCKAPYQIGNSASSSKGTCIQYQEVETKTSMVNCQGCTIHILTDVASSTDSALVGFGGLFGPGAMIVSL
jgi:hypothetical protein